MKDFGRADFARVLTVPREALIQSACSLSMNHAGEGGAQQHFFHGAMTLARVDDSRKILEVFAFDTVSQVELPRSFLNSMNEEIINRTLLVCAIPGNAK